MDPETSVLKDEHKLPDQSAKHVVMILGMHRSGTSAVGRLFRHLGFYFGNNLIGKIDKINADGFWEDRAVVAINERILELLGSSWYSFQALPQNWWESSAMEECYMAAAKWFEQDFNYQSPAAIKDPRFCRLLPFWLYFFNQRQIKPKIIFIYRHPYSVAASLNKRDGFSSEVSCLLWLHYILDALEAMSGDALTLLSYEKLIDNPVQITKSLLNDGLKGIPALKRLRFSRIANSTIDVTKNHNPFNVSMNSVPVSVFSSLACELYKELGSLTPGNLTLITDAYRKRLGALTEHSYGLLTILQAEVDYHVVVQKKLSTLGEEHAMALSVLSKKDAIYERSLADAEKRIEGSKAYIKKCEERIKAQDTLLKALGKKAELSEHFQTVVADRENKISNNIEYINKCEERIKAQDILLKTLGKKAELSEHFQTVVADRENKISENIAYIKKCESRIREQDAIILFLKSSNSLWPRLQAMKKLIKQLAKKWKN